MRIPYIINAKLLLTIIAFGLFASVFGQKPTITLTFTASKNGQQVSLNSILIENLTQGIDTTLYAPDTVLMMDYVTGVDDHRIKYDAFSISQNYPNPIEGKTCVDIHLPEKTHTMITVNNIVGKELLRYEGKLDEGAHSLTFFPGGESIYFLTARVNHQSQTIKMFNTPSNTTIAGNCKLIYNGSTGKPEGYKSVKANVNFVFRPGDQLKYTAYSDIGERTITDSPTGNQTYTFLFDGAPPCPGMPTVTDIDGNVYGTVLIGTQCWMNANLRTTTYRDGTPIPNVTGSENWENLGYGAYVWYNNDVNWKESYGALYNWYAAVFPYGLCPAGWHVPANDEWTVLTGYLGGTDPPHGNELKSCRQVGSPLGGDCSTNDHPRWKHYDSSVFGTDDYGFSGLPAGYRYYYGPFAYLGRYVFWWSSTESSATTSFYRGLFYESGHIASGATYSKQNGFSVRCLRD